MVEAADDDVVTTTTETTAFPVVLYDGERETNVGNISIHPDLVFKEFQTSLSKLIGISYNNLTTYLIDGKKSKISPDRRKFLITGKVNFAVIVRETNCYFLVVLKRSRRDRRKSRPVKQSDLDLSPVDLSRVSLLNRNRYAYDDRFHDLLMYREKYINMILNPEYGYGYGYGLPLNLNFPTIGDAYPRVQMIDNRLNNNRSFCEECRVAEKQGKVAEFHLCVNDKVVVGGFRSPAGPVSRPV